MVHFTPMAHQQVKKPVSSEQMESKSFGQVSGSTLRDVRASVTDMLAAIGLGEVRPATLAERLGIDKTLAWKLSRFVRSPDPLGGFRHLPGSSGMDIVLRAVTDAGATEPDVEKVRGSLERLETLIDSHGGDRATFQILADNHARAGSERASAENRRQLFRSASSVWGVQADAQVLLTITHPSREDNDLMDIAHVSGFVNLQRLRPNLPWVVRRNRYGDDDADTTWRPPETEPLEPGAGADGSAPILRAFSSPDLPELRRFNGGDGFTYHELPPGPVGKVGALTCYMGEIVRRAAPRRYAPNNTVGLYRLTVRTPVKHVLFDMVLHKDVPRATEPRVSVHSLYEGRPPQKFDDPGTDVLPVDGQVQPLGTPPRFSTPKIPGYRELAASVLERAGWDPAEFEAWRLIIEHPPAPCTLTITFDLDPGSA